MIKTKRFCVGFLFSLQQNSVVLIRKERPEWQMGKLNGVGGKIEGNETPFDAMSREFHEETGVLIAPEDWLLFLILHDDTEEWEVSFFFCAYSDRVREVSTQTDEKVEVIDLSTLSRHDTIPNLQWLIPMALQGVVESRFWPYVITQGSE